jgi:hypothetical protein
MAKTSTAERSTAERKIVFAPETSASFLSKFGDANDAASMAEIEIKHPVMWNLYWFGWMVVSLAIFIAGFLFGLVSAVTWVTAEIAWAAFMFFLPEIVGLFTRSRKD